MGNSLLRTDREFFELYERYVDMVFRIGFAFMKNQAEAEDAVQDVFVKLLTSGKCFDGEEHEKAWLIVTTASHCKNRIRRLRKEREIVEEGMEGGPGGFDVDEMLQVILDLPEKYKLPLYSYYYEGYSCAEAAKILRVNGTAFRTRLKRGREILKKNIALED